MQFWKFGTFMGNMLRTFKFWVWCGTFDALRLELQHSLGGKLKLKNMICDLSCTDLLFKCRLAFTWHVAVSECISSGNKGLASRYVTCHVYHSPLSWRNMGENQNTDEKKKTNERCKQKWSYHTCFCRRCCYRIWNGYLRPGHAQKWYTSRAEQSFPPAPNLSLQRQTSAPAPNFRSSAKLPSNFTNFVSSNGLLC